ncbi:MAG: peptidoglycan-binding protein [Oscillospiraceae bacterium]|nr:peptidoglycan-binding protein [Oscillospiraceae bacterium]
MTKAFQRTVTLLLALVTVLTLLPVANADAASMKRGSSGTQVRYLQQNLIGLGYLTGDADGSYGKQTESAVREFQSAYGLTVDGNAGNATQTALRNAVVRLQVELSKLGYNPGGADGHFGSNTKKALLAFQRAKGLKQTGTANSSTWAAINDLSGGMTANSVGRGSSGTQVKYLQQALIGLGFLSGEADGKYGTKTADAVRSYQRAYGLTADGSAGKKTMTSLKNTVVALQSDLARRGYESGTINGVYGNGTKSAVKAYQRYVGVAVTGVAGPKTMVKLYGYSLGGSDNGNDSAKVYKTWIDSLYQDGDYRKIYYGSYGEYSTTVHNSGCGGVALAMALNAMMDTDRYTGQNVMQWFADNGYYYGKGTYQSGIWKYPRWLGIGSTYCDTASSLISHLKQGRLAVALIKDKTGDEFFTYSGSRGHYILLSGYREKDGVDQVFVNNPLSWKSSKWFDIDDLMDNVCNEWQGYENSFVIIYK